MQLPPQSSRIPLVFAVEV